MDILTEDSMDIREELIREWFQRLVSRDFRRLGELLAGRDTIVHLYTKSAEIFDHLIFDIAAVHLVKGGAVAVAEYTCDAIALPTGRPYQNIYAAIFKFRDGRISLWREYHDPGVYDRAFAPTGA